MDDSTSQVSVKGSGVPLKIYVKGKSVPRCFMSKDLWKKFFLYGREFFVVGPETGVLFEPFLWNRNDQSSDP